MLRCSDLSGFYEDLAQRSSRRWQDAQLDHIDAVLAAAGLKKVHKVPFAEAAVFARCPLVKTEAQDGVLPCQSLCHGSTAEEGMQDHFIITNKHVHSY